MGGQVKSPEISCLIYKDQKYTCQQAVATVFNQFFCNVAQDLCNALPSTASGDFKFNKPPVVNSLSLESTTELEMEETITGINNKKSVGE